MPTAITLAPHCQLKVKSYLTTYKRMLLHNKRFPKMNNLLSTLWPTWSPFVCLAFQIYIWQFLQRGSTVILFFPGGWRQQLRSVCFLFWNLQQLYIWSSWWDSSGSYLCKVSWNIVSNHYVLLYHLSFPLSLGYLTF